MKEYLNKAGYTAQDAPSRRTFQVSPSKITGYGLTEGWTDRRTDREREREREREKESRERGMEERTTKFRKTSRHTKVMPLSNLHR